MPRNALRPGYATRQYQLGVADRRHGDEKREAVDRDAALPSRGTALLKEGSKPVANWKLRMANGTQRNRITTNAIFSVRPTDCSVRRTVIHTITKGRW
jgi:hypothetical protein